MDLKGAIRRAGDRPTDDASRSVKKRYSERVSQEIALAVAEELRKRGLPGTLPDNSGGRTRGSERRIAGGLGDKKVDVTFSTPHAGLVLAVSVKTISFRDPRTKNYQKNLQNRKADLVFEVTTLHKRFPYAVVGGLFFLHKGAKQDALGKARVSTFERAHQVLRIFNLRTSPRNEESKFEYLAIGLYGANPATHELYEAGKPQLKTGLDTFLSRLLEIVAERNPEDFVFREGKVVKPKELGIAGGADAVVAEPEE